MHFIEFFGMGTIASLHTPIEFWTPWREHIQDNTLEPAGCLKGTFEFTASINLDCPDGEWRALKQRIQELRSQKGCRSTKHVECIPFGDNVSRCELFAHHCGNRTD